MSSPIHPKQPGIVYGFIWCNMGITSIYLTLVILQLPTQTERAFYIQIIFSVLVVRRCWISHYDKPFMAPLVGQTVV